MFGSSAVDVAIGLIFIFAVFSLLTSGIQELIASILARRSRNLWDSLDELFGDAALPEGQLIDLVYGSPLVTQLVTPKRRAKMTSELSETARRLRGADVSVAKQRSVTSAGQKAARIYGPTSISPASFTRALIDIIRPDGQFDHEVDKLRETINKLNPDPENPTDFTRTLNVLIDETAGDFAKFRAAIEQWYENQMDHVTEWYRRNTRIWLFLIGLVLAGLFNVDTIGAGVELWQDDEIRAAVVAEAATTEAFELCQAKDDVSVRTSCIEGAIGDVDVFPIGYSDGWDADLVSSFVRLVGWVITAAAMMAGAAFWFDLLRRAISLKGRIKTAKSPV